MMMLGGGGGGDDDVGDDDDFDNDDGDMDDGDGDDGEVDGDDLFLLLLLLLLLLTGLPPNLGTLSGAHTHTYRCGVSAQGKFYPVQQFLVPEVYDKVMPALLLDHTHVTNRANLKRMTIVTLLTFYADSCSVTECMCMLAERWLALPSLGIFTGIAQTRSRITRRHTTKCCPNNST